MNDNPYNLPSTDLKTWVLEPVKKEWEPIYLTTAQMEGISRAWKNNVMAELRDAKTGNLNEVVYRTDWRPRPVKVDYKEAKERGGRRWICDYGTRHPMHVGVFDGKDGQKEWQAQCECPKKFDCRADEFTRWCNGHFKNISYPHQITAYMQDEYLRLKTLTPIQTHV